MRRRSSQVGASRVPPPRPTLRSPRDAPTLRCPGGPSGGGRGRRLAGPGRPVGPAPPARRRAASGWDGPLAPGSPRAAGGGGAPAGVRRRRAGGDDSGPPAASSRPSSHLPSLDTAPSCRSWSMSAEGKLGSRTEGRGPQNPPGWGLALGNPGPGRPGGPQVGLIRGRSAMRGGGGRGGCATRRGQVWRSRRASCQGEGHQA